MRILLNDYAGHPFQLQLAEELRRRGHDVLHQWCSNNLSPHADFGAAQVRLEPIDTGGTFEKYKVFGRIRDEIRYGRASAAGVKSHDADVVLASNVPVISLAIIWMSGRWRGVRRVLWLQDIQSGLAAHKLTSKLARIPVRLFEFLEWATIRNSDHVVTISEAFTSAALRHRVLPVDVTEIENWAVLSEPPSDDAVRQFRSNLSLTSEFLFLYSGTLGIKHRPELLRQLAKDGTGACDVVVISEGIAADALSALGLSNLHVLPFLPFEALPEALAAADALVVLLDPAAEGFSVPSKLLTYLCAGRAVVAAAPLNNVASLVINHRARCGFAVADGSEFVSRALALIDRDLSELEARARTYSQESFAIQPIADRFEAILG